MKKLAIFLLICLLAGAAVFYLMGQTHEHDFTGKWSSDANNHWKTCVGENCQETAEKAAHSFDDGEVTTPATEEAEGVMTYTCKTCGYAKTEAIEKLTHTHNLTKVDEAPASCTQAGTEAYYECSGCDKLFSDAEGENVIDAPVAIGQLSHKDETPKDHKCDACNTDVGVHEAATGTHNCDYCGVAVSTCEGNYDEGEITTPPSCLEDGEKTYTCQVCGGTKNETVSSTGHTDTNGDYECDTCYTALCTSHLPEADDGDCTTPIKCSICGTVTTEGAESHTPNADDGNCTTDIVCSVCGTVTTEGAESHTPNADDGDCTTDIVCSECGTVTTEGAESHTPNADDGDCTTSIKCSVCSTVTTEGAESHTPNADVGDCTTPIKCSVCGTVTTPAADNHTPADAVKENVVAATCTATGSYESVVYCATCNKELSRTSNVETMLGHSWNGSTCVNCNSTKVIFEGYQGILNESAKLAYGRSSSGDDYIDWSVGGTIRFSFTASTAGTAILNICSGQRQETTLDQVFTIKVNGTEINVSSIVVANLGGWFNWGTIEVGEISLVEGINTIEIIAATNKYNVLDNISLVLPTGQTVKHASETFEASKATLGGAAKRTEDTNSKPSGNDFVDLTNSTGTATYKFTASSDGVANLYIRLGRRGNFVLSNVYVIKVNGVELDLSSISFEVTNPGWWNWGIIPVGQISLVEGENTIEIGVSSQHCLIDYIAIECIDE